MKQRIQTESPSDALLVWTLSRPDKRPNLIDDLFLDELEGALAEAEQEPALKRLVIRSAHPTVFLAGADLSILAPVPPEDDLRRMVFRGQKLFARLARLPAVTACAIRGACLGGGYELALACDYRILADCPKARVGLPEVTLGLVPAWSGCRRLVRLLGFAKALRVVTTGTAFRPQKARRLGLVDELVHPAQTEEVAREYAQQGKRPAAPFHWDNLPPVPFLLAHLARRAIRRRTDLHYPAPLVATNLLRRSAFRHRLESMKAEQDAFARLARGQVSQNLIRHFFAREEAKKLDFPPIAPPVPEIRRLHLVGAGVMGAGIAQWVAAKGVNVVLIDLSPDALNQSLHAAQTLLNKACRRGVLTPPEARAAMDRITPTTSPAPLRPGDLALEAIVERIGPKRALLAQLETDAPPDVPFATNTSSLSIESINVAMNRPERLGGLHFFNPVHRMEAVEIIRGERTSPAVTRSLIAFAHKIGKRPILCADSPGFLINRVLVPYLAEATRLLLEGHEVPEVDEAMTAFGMPMGPLRLLDEIGLDVASRASREIHFSLPHLPTPPDLPEQLVQAGMKGRKTGAGFYLYDKRRRSRRLVPNPAVRRLLHLPPMPPWGQLRPDRRELTNRMNFLMINEAARCLQEGVVNHPEDVDYGLVAGAGWAPFRGGPLRYAESEGLPHLVTLMERLRRKRGERFRPCDLLLALARHHRTFHPKNADNNTKTRPVPERTPT